MTPTESRFPGQSKISFQTVDFQLSSVVPMQGRKAQITQEACDALHVIDLYE